MTFQGMKRYVNIIAVHYDKTFTNKSAIGTIRIKILLTVIPRFSLISVIVYIGLRLFFQRNIFSVLSVASYFQV